MTKKIAVASGKGGTGKTTIAVNLFYLLVKEGEHAGMADCDVEEPNAGLFLKGELIGLSDVEVLIPEIHSDVCTFCGKCVDICAYNAILMVPSVKHIQVMTDLCHSCGACSYVCPEKGAITEHPKKLGEVRGYGVFDMAAQHAEGRMEIGQAMAVPVIKQTKKLAPRADYQIIDAPPGTSCPAMETIGDADYTILVGELHPLA